MQFVIARGSLQKELAFVQGVVERKNTIPVLANILIESAGEDSIRISGTDLDVTIRCDADAQEIKSQGAICVQARKLFDIASSMDCNTPFLLFRLYNPENGSGLMFSAGKHLMQKQTMHFSQIHQRIS